MSQFTLFFLLFCRDTPNIPILVERLLLGSHPFTQLTYHFNWRTAKPLGPHVFVLSRSREYQTIPSPYYRCYQHIVLCASRVIPPFMEHISSAEYWRNQSL